MKSKYAAVAAAMAMGVLILDARTALDGASAGLTLCIQTVIPSLFPFLVISGYLVGNLPSGGVPLLGVLGRLCRMPQGSEGILLTGLLGGYPVGARCVAQAYESGQLTKTDARRMLGFCSNAGPAFLFGMLSPLFSSPGVLWILWGIHILSALMTGILLPGDRGTAAPSRHRNSLSFPDALTGALKAMASICGWVILFRIGIRFLERWFLWLLPEDMQVCMTGILELTNGCAALNSLRSEGARFLLSALFLGFGGVCVGMQTVSVTGQLGTGMYFPGKIIQGCISFLLAVLVQGLLFPAEQLAPVHPLAPIFAVVFPVLLLFLKDFRKNSSSIFAFRGV